MKKIAFLLTLLMMCFGTIHAQNEPLHGWHTYCTSEFHDVISYGTHTTVATCYPPDMAIQYAGTAITKVGIFSDDLYNSVGGLYTCNVYLGGETPAGGTIVHTMTVDVPQGLGDWAEFDLSTPIWVTGNETIWIVWECTEPLTPFHIGVCSDIDPSGNGIWAWNGSQWEQLWLSTGDWMVKTYFNWDEPQSQDVYFAGNGDNLGKIWKNNDLIYSISDPVAVNMADMKVANDSTIFSVGRTFSDLQSHVWLNDSVLFTADTSSTIERIIVNGNDWTAAGGNKIWQNGTLLYEYPSDTSTVSNIYALAIDNVNGDLYAGGTTATPGVYASVWKNDTLLWMAEGWSSINDLCFDGENLYAAGFMYVNDTLYGIIWQNDSIIVQTENASFARITTLDGHLYWAGNVMDTFYIWQDGEVLYTLPDATAITALVVNEAGVYYAEVTEDIPTVWKDGEILYQPENCDIINAICVRPAPPQPTFTLTVLTDGTGWGTVTGGGTYHYGDTATIRAFPILGHEFVAWNDGIADNPRDIIVTQDSTFIASFARSQFIIKVESDHPNWGSVTGEGVYYYGDTIQISATANLGFAFVGWTDGVTSNPRTVIVTGNQTFTAHFEIRQCVISTEVSPEGSGTVNGGGTYNYGETIHLVAHGNTGYVFDIWADGEIANPRSVFVEGDATYTALFLPLQYQITTGSDPEEGGTVTGGGSYTYGSTATLTAIPNEDYIFLCWNDGIVSNPRNVTVTGNATYKALFHLSGTPQYTVTVLSNDPDLGIVTGSGTYPEGATIEISATPFSGAVFSGWDDGNIDNPRSVVVTSDLTFTAMFSMIPVYTITVKTDTPLLGSVYGSGTYPANTIINIGAVPYQGFYFSGWQDGDMNNPRQITVTENAIYTASFSEIPVQTYTITVYYDENQGFVLGAGTYSAGSIATLAAIPADDYMFVKWSDGTTENPKEIVVNQDITLAAFFNGTGVDENGFITFNLYPNPANDKIRLEGLEGEHEIEIYNVFGMKVKTVSINGDSEISIDDLSAGFYILRIEGHATKFMKQ